MVVGGQAKHGKSALLGALIAAQVADHSEQPDTFGIGGGNPEGKAVIVFDTEQSDYDAWQHIWRAHKRADAGKQPDWLRAFCMTGMTLDQKNQWFRKEIERASLLCNGVHLVILDGIADLLQDPNDAKESFALVEDLHSLAIKHNCAIAVVLHENPSSGFGGATKNLRGHLGSQLERKAETSLRVKKGADGVTVVWVPNGRHGDIPEAFGAAFKWCDIKSMHVSCDTPAVAKAEEKRQENDELVRELFSGPDSMLGLAYMDAVRRIMEIRENWGDPIKERQAKAILKKLTGHQVEKRDDSRYYRKLTMM